MTVHPVFSTASQVLLPINVAPRLEVTLNSLHKDLTKYVSPLRNGKEVSCVVVRYLRHDFVYASM